MLFCRWVSIPYVKLNFDNFKAFRTENSRKQGKKKLSLFKIPSLFSSTSLSTATDPDWSFETDFWYETRFPNQLNVKKLTLEVYDFAANSKNKLIGNQKTQKKDIFEFFN